MLKKIALICLYCFAIIYFLVFTDPLIFRTAQANFIPYLVALSLVLASLLIKNKPLIILSPILLLLFWCVPEANFSNTIPITIVLLTIIAFFFILSKKHYPIKTSNRKEKILLAVFAFAFAGFLIYSGIKNYNCFSLFNSKDFAIYNQTFWNSVQGRLFQNSTYGSNFASHNTIFFFFLFPFYAILPRPETLIILKTLLLTLSIIPFYLIAKQVLKDSSAVPASIAFLIYPYIISLGFLPPHEMCFAPFFILFTYYFFRLNKLKPFIIFLILTLTFKEHLALIAIMFGIYSAFLRRSLRWVIIPIILGVVWIIASLKIISYFHQTYNSVNDASWFLVSMKNKFLTSENLWQSITSIISSSNIGQGQGLKLIFLFLLPLGLVPPLLSGVCILGFPELGLNLLSDRQAMLQPGWHYNVTVSCFLLIGALEGIKKISESKLLNELKLDNSTLRLLITTTILSLTLIYSYTWLNLTNCRKSKQYIQAVSQAIRIIPQDASVTVPRNLAVKVSNRINYSILEHKKYGEYVILDNNSAGLIEDKKILENYESVFDKEGIAVFKKR